MWDLIAAAADDYTKRTKEAADAGR